MPFRRSSSRRAFAAASVGKKAPSREDSEECGRGAGVGEERVRDLERGCGCSSASAYPSFSSDDDEEEDEEDVDSESESYPSSTSKYSSPLSLLESEDVASETSSEEVSDGDSRLSGESAVVALVRELTREGSAEESVVSGLESGLIRECGAGVSSVVSSWIPVRARLMS